MKFLIEDSKDLEEKVIRLWYSFPKELNSSLIPLISFEIFEKSPLNSGISFEIFWNFETLDWIFENFPLKLEDPSNCFERRDISFSKSFTSFFKEEFSVEREIISESYFAEIS